MADYYADFGRDGSGHAGTTADPWSYADMVSNVSSGDVVYARGQHSLTANWSDPTTDFTIRAWDIGLYGPWRLYGGTTYYIDIASSLCYEGIMEVKYLKVVYIEEMYIVANTSGTYSVSMGTGVSDGAKNSILILDDVFYWNKNTNTMDRCAVFFTDTSKYVEFQGVTSTVTNTVTNLTDEADFITNTGGGALSTSNMNYGYPLPTAADWYDADLSVFNLAPGYGAGVAGAWAESLAALFSMSSKGGVGPLTIQFTDHSTGNPQSWLWDFGDGSTSTSQNPEHTYAAVDERTSYTVTLTVTNDADAAAPSWVESGNYYTEEDVSDASLLDTYWWDDAFLDDISSIQDYGGENAIVQNTTTSVKRLSPDDVVFTGDFELRATINFGPTGGGNTSMKLIVYDADTDTSLCRMVGLGASDPLTLRTEHDVAGGHGTGTIDSTTQSGIPAVNETCVIRLKKVDDEIQGSYSIDGGTTWVTAPFTNHFDVSVGGYSNFYFGIEGASVYGWESIYLQGDNGFEKLFQNDSSSKSDIVSLFPALAFPLRGYGYDSSRVAYHYGTPKNPEQGFGWSEIQDGAWVWPDSPASLAGFNDDEGYRIAIGNCSRDGLFYILNTRDGPTSSNFVKRWLDKQDPNNASSGTEIPATIKWPERVGSKQHYTMQHVETHLHIRPIDDDNRGATGYTSDGMRSGQEFEMRLYKNGENSESARAKVLPLSRELVMVRQVRGETLQVEVVTLTSEFKIGRIETYLTVYDRARFPAANSNDNTLKSTDHDLNLMRSVFWMSRGAEMYLNRYNRSVAGTIASKVTGPDSKEKSGAIFQA